MLNCKMNRRRPQLNILARTFLCSLNVVHLDIYIYIYGRWKEKGRKCFVEFFKNFYGLDDIKYLLIYIKKQYKYYF